MKTHARVVVVGGGMMATGLLYHLAKAGWTDVVLLEKAELTSGSTWHAAGQCGNFIPDYATAKLHHYGTQLYPTLEAETGQSVSWHGSGSLRIINSTDELDWVNYALGIARAQGYFMEIVGLDEIRRLHPFYRTEGILAAAYTRDDGHIDRAGLCTALAQGARQRGATIYRHTRVTDIKPRPDGEWEVLTEKGNIVAEHVVNAAGCYARRVGAWVGLELPITNMLHQYVVTETVPEFAARDAEVPVIRDAWIGGYMRQEQKSYLIGAYEQYRTESVWPEGPPWESESELFEADLDRIAVPLKRTMQRIPILKDLGIKRVVRGVITHTADGNVLLGPAPGLRNFWLACGASVGIAQGGGAGFYLAQWMMEGQPESTMQSFDPRRFGRYVENREQVTARSHDDFEHMSVFRLPGTNRTAGRPAKTSALYERLAEQGAVYGEVFGWERPNWFAPPGLAPVDEASMRQCRWFEPVSEECSGVRERVGIADISAFAKFEVTGRDAEAFLNRVFANRMPRRADGIVVAHMLNERGLVEGEVTVTRLGPEHFYVLSGATSEVRDLDRLVSHREADEAVDIENVSEAFGALMLTGPRSRDVLGEVTDTDLDTQVFPWLTGREITASGVPCRALRVSYAGELGWELHVPMDSLLEVYDSLWSAGQTFGIANFGARALNSLRMEKAYRSFGAELNNEITLAEADMLRFACFDKGEFVGREATLEQKTNDLQRRIAYLAVDSDAADCIGAEPVYADGCVVGVTTSGSYGHTVGQSLAFSYVDAALVAPDTKFEVLIVGEKRPARMLTEAAYDPKNTRPRT